MAEAQFGSFGDIPIEITADGETRFSGGVAIAENNVVIHYGDTSIYSDYAQYNPDTRDVLVSGNVRIYRDGNIFVGERALYNLETKVLRTGEFRGGTYPFYFHGEAVSSLEGRAVQVTDATLTTSDSSTPDYRLKSSEVKIYPNSHIIMKNVRLYVGDVPIFWFPFFYQSLDNDSGFSIAPGYDGNWGGYLLTTYTFPLGDPVNRSHSLLGRFHLDLRTKRGAAIGLDVEGRYGENKESWMRLKTYYAQDQDTSSNPTANQQQQVTSERYRVAFQTRTFFREDIYASANINKLSDYRFLRDFYPSDYKNDPQPDNVVSLVKTSENYTLSAIGRFHINPFFDTTERLPEVALDVKRQPIFGSNFFYEGETSVAYLRRSFGDSTDFFRQQLENYDAARIDSFHQVLYPTVLGGWLSVVPRVGLRMTYYNRGARSAMDDLMDIYRDAGYIWNEQARGLYQRSTGDAVFRPIVNAGMESSFKISRVWEEVQSRRWGLDGLRHIVQPYTNFSFVHTWTDPNEILQFDRVNPSTQLPPIDFPQFTTIDSIPSWTIWRFGVRNRLQTRRNNGTMNWLEMDSYFDVNLDQPEFPGFGMSTGTLSNFYNRLGWEPLPWVNFSLDSQVPLTESGFFQVNTSVNMMVTRDLRLTLAHRYLDNNPYFSDGNSLRLGGFYRVNENWGVSFREQYEFNDQVLEVQEYALHRDLSSWVASLGFQVRENRGRTRDVTDYSVVLTFSLKDVPGISLPISFDPSSSGDD